MAHYSIDCARIAGENSMSQEHQLPLFNKGELLIAEVYDPSAHVTLYRGNFS